MAPKTIISNNFQHELGALSLVEHSQGTTFLPSQKNKSGHLEPMGQDPPRTFAVDVQTHFCLSFFMTMVIYLTLTSTLIQLLHLVPKQVLNHSGAKPSQARLKEEVTLAATLYRHQNKDRVKSDEITLKQ